jgi:hypothetical protein
MVQISTHTRLTGFLSAALHWEQSFRDAETSNQVGSQPMVKGVQRCREENEGS